MKKSNIVVATTLIATTLLGTNIATVAKNVSLSKQVRELKVENTGLLDEHKDNIDSLNRLKSELKALDSNYKQLRDILFKELNYDPNNITVPSDATELHLVKALEGTELAKFAPTFLKAEKKYNINAFVLASLVANESSWGTSSRALEDNNYTGYAVYNDYSEGTKFKSPEDCILATAKLLSNDYVNKGGKYYTGSKDIWTVNKVYSTDEKWSSTINSIANKLVKKGAIM